MSGNLPRKAECFGSPSIWGKGKFQHFGAVGSGGVGQPDRPNQYTPSILAIHAHCSADSAAGSWKNQHKEEG